MRIHTNVIRFALKNICLIFFSTVHFKIGTLMNAENADFSLFYQRNQRFSASEKDFVR